jgi:hypothetical protein
MRIASLSILLLLVACSEGPDSLSGAGTVVSVLPGGKDCLVASQRFACSEAAQRLTREMHIALSEPIVVVAVENDRLAAARQTIVAYELKGAGFERVEVRNVGFIGSQAQGGS